MSDALLARSLTDRLAPFRRTLGTTGGLVIATALNNGTGFIFWAIAARTFPAAAVGLGGAAVSAMLLLSQIAMLGLGTSLAGTLHRESRPAALAATALLAVTLAGTILGLTFAIAAPAISDELRPLASSPLVALLFAAGVGITGLSASFDQVLVSMYRSALQVGRNTIFSLGRLLIIFPAAMVMGTDGMSLYATWVAATVVSLAVVGARVSGRLSGIARMRPLMWDQLRQMAAGAFSHHVLNLSRSSSVWLLPIVVTVLISSEANAAFYIALLLANFASVIGTSATFTLYIVGARSPDELWRQMRFTFALAGVAAVGAALVLIFAGRIFLGILAPAYVESGVQPLAVLAASTLPLLVKDHWIALQRLRNTVGRAAAIGVALLVLEIAAAAFGALEGGLIGLTVARFIVLVGQAVFMAPAVYRAMLAPSRSEPGARPPPADAAGC